MKKTIFLLALSANALLFSQWTTNYNVNTLVSNGVTSDISTKGTNDGQTYVMFWDESAGANNYVPKLQLLDAGGNKKFGVDGMVVNTAAPMSTFTYIGSETVDAQNNIYIGFTASGNSHGFIHKISPTGTQLLGASGLDLGENVYNIKMYPTEDGGFYAGWSGNDGATMMKYSSTGTPLWDMPKVIAPPVSSQYTEFGEAAVLSDGSFLTMYHVKNVPWTIDANFWAMRYDTNGNALWANAVQLSDRISAYNRSYSVKQDGDVTYLGYFGVNPSNNFDSFIQRINADGTLPWGLNGTDFSTANTYYEMETSVGFQPGSNVIWSVVTTSNFNQSQFGTAIQKFDKTTGQRQLTDAAKVVYAISNLMNTPEGNLEISDNKPVFLTSMGYNVGPSSPTEYAFTNLDEMGEYINPTGYIKIGTAPGTNKWRAGVSKVFNNQIVAVWAETRDQATGSHAYAQNLNLADFSLAVNDSLKISLEYYPNPVVDYLNISSKEKIFSISVYNAAGQMVKNESFNGLNLKKMDARNLKAGIYLLKLQMENGKSGSIKIIKK